MNARAAILIGLAAFGGVAYASTRPRAAHGAGVDSPDYGNAPALGEWGPLPIFENIADMVEGAIVNQQALSYAGLEQLKSEEGFSAEPYSDDRAGTDRVEYSIGYGHQIKPGEDLTYVTEAQADALLAADVADSERAVRTAVNVPLSVGQFDALVLLAYNIGAAAFRSSTLVRMINAGDYAGAAAQFPRWVRAGGQVNSTLVARRERERAIFEG